MNNKFLKYKKGFSLVEIIVYIGIFSFISVFVVNAFIVSMSSFGRTHTNHILMESGISAMDRVSREIRQASSIDIGNSSLGVNPGILQLNSTNSSGNPIVVRISRVGNSLNIYQPAGTLLGSLISGDIALDNLIFTRIDTIAGEAVKVEITIRDTKSTNNKTEKFYNTIILRGAY